MNVFDEFEQHMKMQTRIFEQFSVLHQAKVRENKWEEKKKKKKKRERREKEAKKCNRKRLSRLLRLAPWAYFKDCDIEGDCEPVGIGARLGAAAAAAAEAEAVAAAVFG